MAIGVETNYDVGLDNVDRINIWPTVYNDGNRGSMRVAFRATGAFYAATTITFYGPIEKLRDLAAEMATVGAKLAEALDKQLRDRLVKAEERVKELEEQLEEAKGEAEAEAATAEEETNGGA